MDLKLIFLSFMEFSIAHISIDINITAGRVDIYLLKLLLNWKTPLISKKDSEKLIIINI